jgi:hypothetical protein
LYADRIGMHSVWIGEHHFNSLGVLSCPDLALSYIAARTTHIGLAPAVTVLPLHHPSASPSNGRRTGGWILAAGFSEVLLYFNVGLKPHQQVKDEGSFHVRSGARLRWRSQTARRLSMIPKTCGLFR